MVARLSPEKQQDHLLKAWPQVLAAVPDAKLDFGVMLMMTLTRRLIRL